jgi:hypothetical protein
MPPNLPRRRNLLGALAAAGLLTSAEMLGLIRGALAAGANPVLPGLHKIKGVVTVNGSAAREGQLVTRGDTVVTAPGAETLYVIGQDAFLQRADTTVHFGETANDFMRVLSGRLLSVFGKGQRRIHVSTATIGIRGTACYIEEGKVGPGGTAAARTYFCLCYGEAEIVPSAAPLQREIIRTTHHDHPIYINADPAMATSMVGAPVINHTDAELVMLESLVGRVPPFYGKTGSSY